MTTYVDFVPSALSPFQFQATLDGQTCTFILTWNLAAQRYYANLYDQTSTLVACVALIGSPVNWNNSLTVGYFDTVVVYREQNHQFEIDPPAFAVSYPDYSGG